jgi:hypothetical protein
MIEPDSVTFHTLYFVTVNPLIVSSVKTGKNARWLTCPIMKRHREAQMQIFKSRLLEEHLKKTLASSSQTPVLKKMILS